MQTLETLQKVIHTTEDLQSIVRTMKVLAAVSIRQYERAVESLVDYSRTVDLGIQGIVHRNRLILDTRPGITKGGLGVIVFGSDHGLCGRFNETICNFTVEKLNGLDIPIRERRILTVGARISAALEAQSLEIEECFFVPGSVGAITATVRQILIKLDIWRREDREQVLLFYNEHRQGATRNPKMLCLLPIQLSRFNDLKKRSWPSRSIPTYTMSDEHLFSALVRQYLFISIFRACAESLASEHASRLFSMQIAEKNIKERLGQLGTDFRQQRQNAITEELLDVVAGFEALTS